jgi:hypothetical protein
MGMDEAKRSGGLRVLGEEDGIKGRKSGTQQFGKFSQVKGKRV